MLSIDPFVCVQYALAIRHAFCYCGHAIHETGTTLRACFFAVQTLLHTISEAEQQTIIACLKYLKTSKYRSWCIDMIACT